MDIQFYKIFSSGVLMAEQKFISAAEIFKIHNRVVFFLKDSIF